MTVKARHIRNMRAGLKRLELRKTRPGQETPFRVWICESGSGGMVVARFDCPWIRELTGTEDGEIAQAACITRAEVSGYRAGGQLFGWRMENFDYFKQRHWLHITDFGLKRPPQSWGYAKEVPDDD